MERSPQPNPEEGLSQQTSAGVKATSPRYLNVRLFFSSLLGAVFLFLCGMSVSRSDLFFVTRLISPPKWYILYRYPNMPPGFYHIIHPAWFLLGIPLLLILIGLTYSGFRRALASLWRQRKNSLPFVLTLVFLLVSFYPWNRLGPVARREMGVHVMLYLWLGFASFVLFLIAFYPLLRFVDSPMEKSYRWLMNLRRAHFLLLVTGFFFILTNLISLLVFEHLPHIQDSIAQLFQARIFAQGKIHLVSPPFPDFFDYLHIINNGRWYSQYLWLHSFILMLFLLLRMPWLANPVLGTLTLPVIYLLGRELYDEKTGRISAILACLSPFIFNMSSEYMNHASALLFASLFLLFYFRTLNRGSLLNPILAGISIGLVANIRPLSGLAICLPFAIYSIYLFLRAPRKYLPRFSLMLVFALAVTSLIFLYNWLANGSPFLFGYVVNWGPGHEVGFGHSGWGAAHTPYRGLLNTGNKLNNLNKSLFEWPVPALLFVAIPFALGTRRRNDWLLLACFLFLLFAYFFYFFSDACFGPRFLYESAACLIILSSLGLIELPELLHQNFGLPHLSESPSISRFYARSFFLILLFLIGTALPPLFEDCRRYGGVSAQVAKNVKKAGLNNALVFCNRFGEGFSYNRLSLDGPVVYARDLQLLNPALTLVYPDRRCFYASYDTLIELKGLNYQNSPLKQTLDQLCQPFADTALAVSYKTIIVPCQDLPLWLDTTFFANKIIDYRAISREIRMGRCSLEDYCPALALWLVNDNREHLDIFPKMDTKKHFVSKGLTFTPILFTENGLGVVYDIR